MTLGWWDIHACPTLFLTKTFFFVKKNMIFSFLLLSSKFIDNLNICFMIQKSIIKTFVYKSNIIPQAWVYLMINLAKQRVFFWNK